MKKVFGLLICTVLLSSVAFARNEQQSPQLPKEQQSETLNQVSFSKGFLSLFNLFTTPVVSTDSLRKSSPVFREKAVPRS